MIAAAELVNLRQGKDEPLRAFMHRYTEAARRVKGITHEFIIRNLPNCLKPGYVSETLYVELPNTLEELQEKMTKFIKMEDQRNFRRKTDVPTNEHKQERKHPREGDRNQRPPRRDLLAALGPRYDRYTNLTIPRERVFEKALQANIIFIHKRYTPRGVDETKSCRFHDNRGHTTKSCQVLKDEIERLIRAGHLREFVKEEPRQRRRSPKKTRRSPERPQQTTERSRERSRS
ncbi:uncharacterized protein LOC106753487 [Vigna radiata var. radiata]|uniref:Uncharacterized protein LOC106753487 n=1 Tax=Vigna radiata var. radiata TaxID=3916 RepID=A0A1S3TAJ9_VIGRR|nr:uncharacterized protein LOC106753487 [Vigna radiata var. radiata]